ncbi:unnamed protein product [Urochloa decumbens]|uniref:Dirigent protein n=1 Tax=Urochloa decumbens TaxID=240449 RepID=A0ABC9C2F8_9POAL
MGSLFSPVLFLMAMFPAILAIDIGIPGLQCQCPKPCEIDLHYYLHQFRARTDPKSNEDFIVSGTNAAGFGTTIVHDWSLTTGPNATDTIVGHAQGFHMQAAQTSTIWYTTHNIIFQDRFAGSTLQVMGIIDGAELTANGGEWSIIGGTGKFVKASGIVTVKAIKTEFVEWVRELNIKVSYAPENSSSGYGYNGYDGCN